ncbi:hypothetical protein O988_04793 [Pseudogymnoascus sp. VKM F-3808]|nr:hypothetical protein O988_04793 [Pseudogymnoascus sp. VKM F-3808]
MAQIRQLHGLEIPEGWGLLLPFTIEFSVMFVGRRFLYFPPLKLPGPWRKLFFSAVHWRENTFAVFTVLMGAIPMLWGLENFFFTELSPYLAQGRVINLPQRLMLFGFAPTFLSVFCIAISVRQSYVRTRVKRFFPGYRRRRADRLLYIEQYDDGYLISNTWFDIIDLISKTDDEREAINL